jgi:hypothetical protein
MPSPKFNAEDVDDKPAPDLRELILDLMLSWPELEYGLACWIAFALKVRPSEAAIMLGTANNRTKIDKLKALYEHRGGDQQAVALLKQIAKEYKAFADVRNTIAHAMLLGTSKTNPNTAYFLTTRAVPDEHGFMVVKAIDFRSLKEAQDLAFERAMNIREMLKARGAEVD